MGGGGGQHHGLRDEDSSDSGQQTHQTYPKFPAQPSIYEDDGKVSDTQEETELAMTH